MSIKSEFPNEIDLGKKANDGPMMPSETKGKKDRKYYPTLYLNDIGGLENLPAEGEAVIYFVRRGLTIRKPGAGEKGSTQVSVDLEIRKICLPDAEEGEPDDKGDLIDELAEKAGVDTGRKPKKTADDEDEE
jgi:hypothetical protein